jgi:uncharacterized membrane protein
MGILDSIFGKIMQDKGTPKVPFAITTSFRPMRLSSRVSNYVDLLLGLKNLGQNQKMCSVVIELPKQLGFDSIGLHKTKELRLGAINGGETKNLAVQIHANSQTPPGLYRLKITVYEHYRDYAHVLNSVSKTIELRVV